MQVSSRMDQLGPSNFVRNSEKHMFAYESRNHEVFGIFGGDDMKDI